MKKTLSVVVLSLLVVGGLTACDGKKGCDSTQQSLIIPDSIAEKAGSGGGGGGHSSGGSSGGHSSGSSAGESGGHASGTTAGESSGHSTTSGGTTPFFPFFSGSSSSGSSCK